MASTPLLPIDVHGSLRISQAGTVFHVEGQGATVRLILPDRGALWTVFQSGSGAQLTQMMDGLLKRGGLRVEVVLAGQVIARLGPDLPPDRWSRLLRQPNMHLEKRALLRAWWQGRRGEQPVTPAASPDQ